MILYIILLSLLIIYFVITICGLEGFSLENFNSNNSKIRELTDKKYRFAVIYTDKRLPMVEKLEKDLDIKLERWPAVFTNSCPRNKNYSMYAKKFCSTCRGLSIAHKEIWHDFVNSDSNYILIFEDDAQVESIGKIDEIYKKLNNIEADITYMGHCYGHLCLHAYVLTREGAKILLENIQTCGAAIDEQLSQMITDNIIEAEFVKNPGEKKHWTQGLFHQVGKTDGDGSMQSYHDMKKPT